jgi:hypothetical protein
MYWNSNINQNYQEERPTAEVYRLRKAGQIIEAYNLANSLYAGVSDDDVKKALSWATIDLCKKFIAENNLIQAQLYFNQLSNIQFDYEDEFVETIQKQIRFLKPKIDVFYGQIQEAEQLSKNGQEKLALEKIRTMRTNGQLSESNHETCGWIIYRYMKTIGESGTSIEVRTLLRDYMNLNNERPSMLHSMILNFALNYSKKHSDFIFYNFFKLWDANNLRYEDLHDSYKDGKNIPSLISRICREFVYKGIIIENEIIAKIYLSKETVIDFFRESYFWLVFSAHKENRFPDLWNLFSEYNAVYGKYGKSKWHSEILKLADRFMKENESWRFILFFKEWNPENFMDADWKEEKGKDGETYKPLAIKAIKKSFEIIKNKIDNKQDDYLWLSLLYDKAIKIFPNDEWLIREKALLYLWQNNLDAAIEIYKKLVLELGDKFYVWSEFSECVTNDNNLKIGMLSKALSLEKNEDFLGDIHLKLAKILIDENLLENALFELNNYKKHREEKGWKIQQKYENLSQKTSMVNLTIKDNFALYEKYIPFAEEFAYNDITWTEVALVDRWKTEEKKERLCFTDGNDIELTIGIGRFPILKKAKVGEIYKFKLDKQENKKEVESQYSWQPKKIITEYKYISLLVEKSCKSNWAILPEKYGFIEYINQAKKTLHIITNDSEQIFYSFDKEQFNKGQFLTFKQYKKKVKAEIRNFCVDIKKCDKEIALPHFKSRIAVIDDVNETKGLFHYVLGRNLLTGIAFFDDTNIRPTIGNFLKVYYCVKKDKDGKKKIVTLHIEQTDEQNSDLRKPVTGELELKNDGKYGFINDYYVPKSILEKYEIADDCYVTAQAVYTGDGDKWKVYEIDINN